MRIAEWKNRNQGSNVGWVSGFIAERVLLGLKPLTTTAYSLRVQPNIIKKLATRRTSCLPLLHEKTIISLPFK